MTTPSTFVVVVIHVPDHEHVDNPPEEAVWDFYQQSGGVTEATWARPGPGGFVKTRPVTYEFKLR